MIQKVFGAVSPKIVIKFLNYVATVDTREPGLTAEFLREPGVDKARFFRIVLAGQSNERTTRIKSSLTPEAASILTTLEQAPPGMPATLLRYMHANRIFSDNSQRSVEMANQRGGNDSQRTIQRELRVLIDIGLVEGDRDGYHLADWVRAVGVENVIKDNPELEEPSLSDADIKKVKDWVSSNEDPMGSTVVSALPESEELKPDSLPVSSPSNPTGDKKPGGVDFRALPIVTQSLNTPRINMPLSGLDNFRADPEWNEIQNMINAGIIPSGQRIKDYLQSCCRKKELNEEIGRVLNCIADIMRIEEERVSATDPEFKDMLVLLESGKSTDELTNALNKIDFHAGEPSLIPQ